MFKYAIFLFVFCFYNTDVLAMRPAAPTDAVAGAPAEGPAVAAIATDLINFTLGDTPITLAAICVALDMKLDDFPDFLKSQRLDCLKTGLDFAKICADPTPHGSLIDYAFVMGCNLETIQALHNYGKVKIHSINSPNPTIEKIWRQDKHPDQRNIITWLVATDNDKITSRHVRDRLYEPGDVVKSFQAFSDRMLAKYPHTKWAAFAIFNSVVTTLFNAHASLQDDERMKRE